MMRAMQVHMWQQRKKELSLVDAMKAKKVAAKFVRDGDRVIDMGCGDCDFFDLVVRKRQRVMLYGFDIVPEALKICKDKGYIPVKSLRGVKKGVDVVTMFECFEHLTYEQRRMYAQWIRRMLKDGGYVVLSFPHIRSLLSIVHYYDNPEHKEPFPLESNLMKFFEGFTMVEKRFLSPWINPVKVVHCLLTGLSVRACYNNVCFVLQKTG